MLGIDVFTNQPFRSFDLTDFQSQKFDIQQWLRGPRSIAISEEFARQRKLHAGDEITVQINGETTRLTIGFVLRIRDPGAKANPHFAAMDIGWAQELFGPARQARLDFASPHEWSRSASGRGPVAQGFATRCDGGHAGPARRRVEKMLAGFELNLQAMSLVSLLVGMFLIYNAIEASVVRRRSEIGILRSLGATRSEVRWLFSAKRRCWE